MLKTLSHVNVWVHDQDEALAFYTEKLGFEVREDVTLPELGDFRWLTVAPPGQSDFALALMAVPGPPVFAEDTAQKLHPLIWLARRCTRYAVVSGRPSVLAAFESACSARMASGTSVTTWGMRGWMVAVSCTVPP